MAIPSTTGTTTPTAPSVAAAGGSRPSRRRQRSTRLVVATSLLVVAALAVAGAAARGSWLAALLTGALAVVLGLAGVRITWSEVVAARRDAARDRAAQAQDYLALTDARTSEQAIYVAHTQGTIARHETTIRRLEDRLADAAAELASAHRDLEAQRSELATARDEGARLSLRLEQAEERAAQAIVRVAELEQEHDVLLAEWQAGLAAAERRRA